MTTHYSVDIASATTEPPSVGYDGIQLPRGLREDADTMSWSTLTATYAHSAGPLRLGHWECADAEWAMGWSEDPTRSALCAVIACANRLYANNA